MARSERGIHVFHNFQDPGWNLTTRICRIEGEFRKIQLRPEGFSSSADYVCIG